MPIIAVVLMLGSPGAGAHNAAIMTVLMLVLGAKLIGDAIGGFSS